MNNGSGIATITGGNLVIGSTKELVFTGPGNMTVGSVIQDDPRGASALTMAGSGTLALPATNTYSGPTIVDAGTLQLNSTQAAQDSTVTVNVNNGLVIGSGVTAPAPGRPGGHRQCEPRHDRFSTAARGADRRRRQPEHDLLRHA